MISLCFISVKRQPRCSHGNANCCILYKNCECESLRQGVPENNRYEHPWRPWRKARKLQKHPSYVIAIKSPQRKFLRPSNCWGPIIFLILQLHQIEDLCNGRMTHLLPVYHFFSNISITTRNLTAEIPLEFPCLVESSHSTGGTKSQVALE